MGSDAPLPTVIKANGALLPPLEGIGVAAVWAGIVLGPMLLGSAFPWSRLGLEALMTMAVLSWIASPRGTAIGKAFPVAVATIGLLHLAPLPDWLLIRLAPISAGAWKVAAPAAWGTIAVDPAATAAGLRRLLLGLGLIGATNHFARLPQARNALLAAMTFSCTLTLALAVAFPANPNDRVILGFIDLGGPIFFWKSPVDSPVQTAGFAETDTINAAGYTYQADSWVSGDRIGPYINSNHFAGAMCLLLPVAISFWLWAARPRAPRTIPTLVALLAACFGLYATWATARSRAGTGSLALGLATLAALVSSTPAGRRVSVAIMATGVTGWLGAIALMYGRFRGVHSWLPAAIHNRLLPLLTDGRVMATHVALRVWRAAPLFGTGFGSYYGLSTYLDQRSAPVYFAHNDYAQLLAETGLVGAVAIVVGGIFFLRTGWAFYRTASFPERVRDAGCWAALVGIAAHSAFDWNLHVPANAFLACVTVGLAIATVASEPRRRQFDRLDATRRRTVDAAIAVVYVLCFATLARDAWSDTQQRMMRDAIAAARLATTDGEKLAGATQVEKAIQTAERAQVWDPANAQLALLIGHLHLHAADLAAQRDKSVSLRAGEASLQRAARLAAVLRGMPEKAAPAPN